MRTELMTVKMLRTAIRKAREVVVTPRFGVTETYIKITKAEALAFVAGLPDKTPDELEMYGGKFGTLEDGTLYLG